MIEYHSISLNLLSDECSEVQNSLEKLAQCCRVSESTKKILGLRAGGVVPPTHSLVAVVVGDHLVQHVGRALQEAWLQQAAEEQVHKRAHLRQRDVEQQPTVAALNGLRT